MNGDGMEKEKEREAIRERGEKEVKIPKVSWRGRNKSLALQASTSVALSIIMYM
jgi:hypothetical protein